MTNLLTILILLSSFPAGLILAWLCRDELVQGRKWFKLISAVSVIASLILLFVYRNLAVILTLLYICIVSLMSLWKSYEKKWVKVVIQ